jgi:hypothetical protein
MVRGGQYDVLAVFAALPDELPLAEADANTPRPTMASSMAANCRRDLAVIFDLLWFRGSWLTAVRNCS